MLRILSLLFVLCTFTGCGGTIDKYFLPVADDTVQEIYEAGTDAMQAKEYRTASEYFQRIKDDYPFSSYIIDAELNLGDALYLNQQYLDAAGAYMDFEEMHPSHEAIPYVLLQTARSMRQMYRSVDRSTEGIATGLEYANRVIEEYPGTDYALEAQKEAQSMRLLLAQRDVYIAQIYQKMDNYEAAWNRYSKIKETYPDIEEIYTYASEQANINYLKFRERSSEDVREERVGSWKEWFKWL